MLNMFFAGWNGAQSRTDPEGDEKLAQEEKIGAQEAGSRGACPSAEQRKEDLPCEWCEGVWFRLLLLQPRLVAPSPRLASCTCEPFALLFSGLQGGVADRPAAGEVCVAEVLGRVNDILSRNSRCCVAQDLKRIETVRERRLRIPGVGSEAGRDAREIGASAPKEGAETAALEVMHCYAIFQTKKSRCKIRADELRHLLPASNECWDGKQRCLHFVCVRRPHELGAHAQRRRERNAFFADPLGRPAAQNGQSTQSRRINGNQTDGI
jgi:hypothetical protein